MSQLREVLTYLEGINSVSVVLRIFLATLVGGCIGLNRGRHGRVAGMRTHILVCLGAAVTALVGFYTGEHLGYANDPLRLGAQVISGVGFLGVGTIVVHNNSQVKGLTTAAGLWATACIGLAIGSGFYLAALLSFAVIMLTVSALARLEKRMHIVEATAYYAELEDLEEARLFYERMKPCIKSVDLIAAKSGIAGHVGLELTARHGCEDELRAALRENERVAITLPLHHN